MEWLLFFLWADAQSKLARERRENRPPPAPRPPPRPLTPEEEAIERSHQRWLMVAFLPVMIGMVAMILVNAWAY